MSCEELVEIITEYLEGKLSSEDRRRFEEHLAECPGCRTYLDHMRVTIRTLGKLTAESVTPEAREELLQVFRNWKKT